MAAVIIETKFDMHQRVYLVRREVRSATSRCATCDGEGMASLANSSKRVFCPDCHLGVVTTWEPERHHVRDLTVGQVNVQRSAGGTRITYMCEETGVGSGTNWPETDLFADRNEAVHECERRDAR